MFWRVMIVLWVPRGDCPGPKAVPGLVAIELGQSGLVLTGSGTDAGMILREHTSCVTFGETETDPNE